MSVTRRQAVTAAIGVTVGAAFGGLYRLTTDYAPRRRSIRPPGARGERAFLAACIRCGQCVEACPYDTLSLVTLAAGFGAGSPVADDLRHFPCTMCQAEGEPLCIRSCPTDALNAVVDFAAIHMGTAVVDESICWAFNGTVCRGCWHACPFLNSAITLNERLRPVVHADACTGCGLCEHACPTEPSSIVIGPLRESCGANS